MRENLRGYPMKVHVVVPCFRVTGTILDLLTRMPSFVERVWVVDDACPDKSGEFVQRSVPDQRIQVLQNVVNLGVGGAVKTGYEHALQAGADVVVKLDGDGQMHPEDIDMLIRPILLGEADYTKGNRFDSLDDLFQMPKIRILGNAVLSLWSKMSSGYWTITDPTNGFTAIHKSVLSRISLEKVANRFFFESDLLFRLNLAGAVVEDVPLPARYGSEKSNLKIGKVLFEFPYKHSRNHLKRILYRYYLREFSIASLELPSSLFLLIFGGWLGLSSYLNAAGSGLGVTAGQATIASLAIILGFQLILSFLAYDIQAQPRIPRQGRSN